MRKSYWFGWSVALFVFGVVTIIGTCVMADVYTSALDPLVDDTDYMTVGGQTLLLGIAAIVTSVVMGLWGLVSGRFYGKD